MSPGLTLALGLVLALLAVPFLAAGLYLLLLALASFRRSPEQPLSGRGPRLTVLVPAHDEEPLVGRCVSSLLDQTYPAHLYRVVVIADNCRDHTASAARRAGAEVLERNDQRAPGKGRALRWAMDTVLRADPAMGAAVVVDADSVADRDLLARLADTFSHGAEVVQAEYLVLTESDTSARARLVEAAFLLFHRVRLGGRTALGLPVNLVGNGMLFGRRVLETLPWNAFTAVEDLEYSVNLRLSGFAPRYAARALVRGPVPHGYSGMSGQRVRWEGGRFHLFRTRLPQLLAHAWGCDVRVLDAAVDLAVPPLGLLAMIVLGGAGLAGAAAGLGLAPAWTLSPWLAALGAIVAFVVVGLRSAAAPGSTYLALLGVPRFLLWKLLTYARLGRGFDPSRWEHVRRDTGTPGDRRAEDRVEIAGVPIDNVDMGGAQARLREALAERQQLQVATVNLDFLVGAQRNRDLMAVLRRSELNLADGKPVVWLGRLLGHPLPERIAGADLVPLLVGHAAEVGARVFLLGGEGVAEAAARRLERDHPGLQVAGWLEPPRAPLEAMDSGRLLDVIRRSASNILLVALGNPKQELWIARHRDELPDVSILVGVGCVFDLLAGRAQRAPGWMQSAGLEWLHRLIAEPRRLAGRYLSDGTWLLYVSLRILLKRARGRPVEAA